MTRKSKKIISKRMVVMIGQFCTQLCCDACRGPSLIKYHLPNNKIYANGSNDGLLQVGILPMALSVTKLHLG
jgi:hypothetical protein